MNQAFSIAPLPGALFLTPSLNAALHKLQFTITRRQGLALLLGDPGHGKSTILRRLAADLGADDQIVCAFIPDVETSTLFAFVRSICEKLGVPAKRSILAQKDALKAAVFAHGTDGKNVVLLLDEAQGLSLEMLEMLRGFLNYQTNAASLIQIILAGQLELRERIKSSRAVKSRVVMSSLLSSLTFPEMTAMLRHRCATFDEPFRFDEAGLLALYQATAGVPRDCLRICAIASELAQLSNAPTISEPLISGVIAQEEKVYGN